VIAGVEITQQFHISYLFKKSIYSLILNKKTMEHLIDLASLKIEKEMPGVAVSFFNTQHVTLAYTQMKAGVLDAWHNHPFEVIGIVLNGEFEMECGGKTQIYKPGVISYLPAGTMHQVVALSDCSVLTVMYPKQQQ
jgi:quercetin dioxygenase-like cupin family protein